MQMDLAKQSDLEYQHLYCSSIHRAVPKLDEGVTFENEKTTLANHPFYFICIIVEAAHRFVCVCPQPYSSVVEFLNLYIILYCAIKS